jgi:hypothetical protein
MLICGVNRTVKGSANDGSAVALLLCGNTHTFKGGPYDGNYRNVVTCGLPRVFRGGSCSGDYFQVSFCTGEMYTFKPCVSTIMLPIELSLFRVDCSGNLVTVKWETETEKNNARFYLERALTTRTGIQPGEWMNWEVIANIPGGGNSHFRNTYQFVDDLTSLKQPGDNTSLIYYRLRQKDFDGTESSYFPAVIHFPCSDNPQNLVFYPDAASGHWQISGISGLEYLEILNAIGQRVFYQNEPGMQIELDGLAAGIYFLSALTEKQEKLYYKFYISK